MKLGFKRALKAPRGQHSQCFTLLTHSIPTVALEGESYCFLCEGTQGHRKEVAEELCLTLKPHALYCGHRSSSNHTHVFAF